MSVIGIEPYMYVRSAKYPEYDPTCHKLSFIADYTGIPQVWEINLGDEWPVQTSYTRERITFVSYVTGTSNKIIGMDTGGNEKQQLYLLGSDGKLKELTKSPDHIHRFGGTSPDSKWIAWSSNRQNPAFFDIYIQNLETLEIRLILAGEGIFSVVKWSPDGKSLLVQKINSPLDNDLGILDLSTGVTNWLTEHKGEASFKDAHFNKDGDHLYVLSNKDREFYGLGLINIKTKHFVWLERGRWDFEGLSLNKDKNMAAYTINQAGISKGVLLDINRSYLYTWETPMGVISNLKFSPDSQKLAYTFKGPAYPSDIWELDVNTIKAERLTYVSRSPVLDKKLVEPEHISFRSFDGLEIPAFYYLPQKKEEKYPIVIYLHGGPESQSRAVYNPVLQYFLNQGYAVCTPNVRGSTGYGKTFTHLDDVQNRMDAVKDLIFLVEWLKVNRNIDPKKIGIMGGSYGGFLVLAAISHYPEIWTAGIDIVGMSSLRTFLQTTSPWRKKHREFEYGTIERDGEFFDKIDPLHHSERISSPLLVIHGESDPRVHIKESEQIVTKLKDKQHPVDFIRFEDEGHSIEKQKNKTTAYKAMVTFFDRYLGEGS
ncbi:S9 family peptidase [Neobacillus drentensis]|uniref:S9 family peptidase n=1 Tax=Neobacillus drentensis TaxID=220684 RepID=UPI00300029F5